MVLPEFLAQSVCAPGGTGVVQVKVINLEQHRRREVVDALEALLAAAKAGTVDGIAYVVKAAEDHWVGTAGVYRRHPEKALQAVFQMERHLCNTGPFASSR
jgi:hypothetical protein